MPRYERDLFDTIVDVSDVEINHPLPDLELKEMLLAFQDVLKRVEQLSHHTITREPLSVRERMASILEKLNRPDSLSFSALFTQTEGKQGVVISFLAILELCKEGLLEIIQLEPFAELRIRTKTC